MCLFVHNKCPINNIPIENRFMTEMECQKTCDRCYQPKDPGPCDGYFPRYYYDYKDEECQKFIYGGCGGNGNNFKTKAKCEKACSEPYG